MMPRFTYWGEEPFGSPNRKDFSQLLRTTNVRLNPKGYLQLQILIQGNKYHCNSCKDIATFWQVEIQANITYVLIYIVEVIHVA